LKISAFNPQLRLHKSFSASQEKMKNYCIKKQSTAQIAHLFFFNAQKPKEKTKELFLSNAKRNKDELE
jgi:hypothetical protein